MIGRVVINESERIWKEADVIQGMYQDFLQRLRKATKTTDKIADIRVEI
jgi:hypothetical protein